EWSRGDGAPSIPTHFTRLAQVLHAYAHVGRSYDDNTSAFREAACVFSAAATVLTSSDRDARAQFRLLPGERRGWRSRNPNPAGQAALTQVDGAVCNTQSRILLNSGSTTSTLSLSLAPPAGPPAQVAGERHRRRDHTHRRESGSEDYAGQRHRVLHRPLGRECRGGNRVSPRHELHDGSRRPPVRARGELVGHARGSRVPVCNLADLWVQAGGTGEVPIVYVSRLREELEIWGCAGPGWLTTVSFDRDGIPKRVRVTNTSKAQIMLPARTVVAVLADRDSLLAGAHCVLVCPRTVLLALAPPAPGPRGGPVQRLIATGSHQAGLPPPTHILTRGTASSEVFAGPSVDVPVEPSVGGTVMLTQPCSQPGPRGGGPATLDSVRPSSATRGGRDRWSRRWTSRRRPSSSFPVCSGAHGRSRARNARGRDRVLSRRFGWAPPLGVVKSAGSDPGPPAESGTSRLRQCRCWRTGRELSRGTSLAQGDFDEELSRVPRWRQRAASCRKGGHLRPGSGAWHNPLAQQDRRIPSHLLEKVGELLKRLLEAGIIEMSSSPWASPIIIVTKKNVVDIWLCIDCRGVDLLIKLSSYPLLLIDELLDNFESPGYGVRILGRWDDGPSQGYQRIHLPTEPFPVGPYAVRSQERAPDLPACNRQLPLGIERLPPWLEKDVDPDVLDFFRVDPAPLGLQRSAEWSRRVNANAQAVKLEQLTCPPELEARRCSSSTSRRPSQWALFFAEASISMISRLRGPVFDVGPAPVPPEVLGHLGELAQVQLRQAVDPVSIARDRPGRHPGQTQDPRGAGRAPLPQDAQGRPVIPEFAELLQQVHRRFPRPGIDIVRAHGRLGQVGR
ncbi:hypothetical protein PybrP1_005969, partial [[Pythium] brassicae (nom. inval.)]